MYKILLCDATFAHLANNKFISCEIDVAHNQEEIYKLTFEKSYDLYIVNFYYYDLFSNLKESGDTIFTIFIDEFYNTHNLKQAFLIGDDYLIKPLYDDDIIVRIQYHYKKFSNHKNNIISYREFYYHLHTKQLYKQNNKIHLSPGETKLAELFLSNIDRVLLKEYIFEKLETSSSGSLRVYISKLNKIGFEIQYERASTTYKLLK